jgi:isopentenyl-diphosphate delta-isomerase
MDDSSLLSNRKADHIRINLAENVDSTNSNGLELFRFEHCALPDINFEDIDTRQSIFGRKVNLPLIISSMTGGTREAEVINMRLAEVAQASGLAMGVGSQRVGLKKESTQDTFRVRKAAPDILLFANIGAVQLNYGYGVDECLRAVEMIEADALYLHLNPLQEALQPEGDTNFSGLLEKIEQVCKQVPVPVFIKEVGWGISGDVALKLASAGVSGIDVAGAGGTSWSEVEKHRMTDPVRAKVAGAFRSWGIPTAESLIQVRASAPELVLISSGGIRSGTDVAKSISLGAVMAGMAGPFLKAIVKSTSAALQLVEELSLELRVCMFAAGAKDIQSLQKISLLREQKGLK